MNIIFKQLLSIILGILIVSVLYKSCNNFHIIKVESV